MVVDRAGLLTSLALAAACFAEPPETGSGSTSADASSEAGTGSTSVDASSEASTGEGSSGVGSSSSGEVVPECDAYCSACSQPGAYDGCHQLCVDGRDMYTNDSGVACGQAWLDWRACIATDSECDSTPNTEGPCRFYARNLLAVCGGVVQGNCGRNPDGGAGAYDYCDGDPSNAGSCPDDVLYENVGTDNCGSLPPFEGCCSPAGDYFYCDPMGDGGMTYEECPAP